MAADPKLKNLSEDEKANMVKRPFVFRPGARHPLKGGMDSSDGSWVQLGENESPQEGDLDASDPRARTPIIGF